MSSRAPDQQPAMATCQTDQRIMKAMTGYAPMLLRFEIEADTSKAHRDVYFTGLSTAWSHVVVSPPYKTSK